MRPRHLSFGIALLLFGCDDGGGPPTQPLGADVLYVNGATFPIARPSERIVIEGVGFGARLGEVRFPTATGETVVADVEADDWSDRFILASVPVDAVSGAFQVVPNTGDALEQRYALLPHQSLASITWSESAELPFGDTGLGVAVGQDLTTGVLQTYLLAALRPPNEDSTAVYVGFINQSGVARWERRAVLPGRRPSAALAIATPHTARVEVPRLFVVGGLDSAGTAVNAVVSATIGLPQAELGAWEEGPPLPRALARPRLTIGRGMLYVTGGIGSDGQPSLKVFVGPIRADGVLEGWFPAPPLPNPRAFHGMVTGDSSIAIIGGVGAVPTGPGIDTLTPRIDTSVRAALSERSGFFVGPDWSSAEQILPDGRSQFALLAFDKSVLAVGGVYSGAAAATAETLAAAMTGGIVGTFTPAATFNTISGLGGGTLVDAIGLAWHDLDGTLRAAVLGGRDLTTGFVRRGVWGF